MLFESIVGVGQLGSSVKGDKMMYGVGEAGCVSGIWGLMWCEGWGFLWWCLEGSM